MTFRYLTLGQYLKVAEVACGGSVTINNKGNLLSALGRPQASAFGSDAYVDVWTKAAALFQSLACNHGLIDGNKRSALMATLMFLALNGEPVGVLPEDRMIELTLDVATSRVTDIGDIAALLRAWYWRGQ